MEILSNLEFMVSSNPTELEISTVDGRPMDRYSYFLVEKPVG